MNSTPAPGSSISSSVNLTTPAKLHAARAIGRAVKLVGTRSEHLLADNHARDALIDCTLALDAEGRFLAIRTSLLDTIGAYNSVHGPFVTIRKTTNGLSLVYKTDAIAVDVRLVMTNTASTGSYRGAGREQVGLITERLVDQAARETGRDPIALRRPNLIPSSAIRYRSPSGRLYDSGAFEEMLDVAIAASDADGFAARAAESAAKGRLRGRGSGYFLECVGRHMSESADLRFTADGGVDLVLATHSSGQGHETTSRNSWRLDAAVRALQGLGFGAEWAVGAALMGEIVRAEHRGKAVGCGQSSYAMGWATAGILYAGTYAPLPETIAWPALFFVGVLPGIFVI